MAMLRAFVNLHSLNLKLPTTYPDVYQASIFIENNTKSGLVGRPTFKSCDDGGHSPTLSSSSIEILDHSVSSNSSSSTNAATKTVCPVPMATDTAAASNAFQSTYYNIFPRSGGGRKKNKNFTLNAVRHIVGKKHRRVRRLKMSLY
jgi:hypothetical protein